MRYATRFSISWLSAALPLCAALAFGCHGKVGDATGTGGNGQLGGNTGAGGTDPSIPDPACTGPGDPRMVPAPQRILRLTLAETLNTVRYLTDNTEATMLQSAMTLGAVAEKDRRFPPLTGEEASISNSGSWTSLDGAAQHVSSYIATNFATLSGCATATDTCAQTYLNTFAQKAYRRRLNTNEQARITALYNKLKSQMVNGYLVTTTVQEATQFTAYAIMSTPQMLWRWEIGDMAQASTSPAGYPLTEAELASNVSFFLTDQPPDQPLLDAAAAGTLRSGLASHVDRLLATQGSKDWLRTIIATWYLINQLPDVVNTVDRAIFPEFSAGLLADEATEANKFLDNALWNGNLTDLLLSRTAFLNTGLATTIYKVPAPAGATGTNFVQTTLPSDQRAGILTNAAFITRAARSNEGSVVSRGRVIAATILCMPPDPPPPAVTAPGGPLEQAQAMFATQTVQQQVDYRKKIPLCGGCHANFDPYGLVLDYYDNIGRYRTIDDKMMPVDGHVNLPTVLGGGLVNNAIDLAEALGNSPAFTRCMATTMLQYAMVDYTAPVQLPVPPLRAGCAAADVVAKYDAGSSKTFGQLVRLTAASPAFVLRSPAP